jgi:8-oxo-dGTP diphosphatase
MLPAQCGFIEQLYTFSAINRDPRGRVISIAYLVILPDRCAQTLSGFPDSELEDHVVRLDQNGLLMIGPGGLELSASDLAFDHADIVEKGITRLRGKITYTDIGFYFLADPDSFSLRELQTVFEAVLDHPMDSSNFRRMILAQYERSGKICKNGKEEKAGIGRPSVLYSFRQK